MKSPRPTPLRVVGTPTIRVDGLDKITGAARYVDDLDFGPGTLYAALVESPHPHAEILSIDARAATRAPGVVRVVTGADFPCKFGLYMQDRWVFARDRVRFVGEQVAAVLAETPAEALRAAALVRVRYRPLPAVLDLADALQPNAVLLHPDLASYTRVPWFYPRPGTNIAHWRKLRKGNITKGFARAHYTLEDTYTVPRYAHCPLEPHAATALCDETGALTLWASSQSPYAQRHVIAAALRPFGLTHRNIRVLTPYVGGGFGGKAGVSMEIIAAVLALAVRGRPVRLLWTREQEFRNTSQRQGLVARVKMGFTARGRITALDHVLHWDAGASAEYGANVVNAVGLSATGPYRIPNIKIDSVCVYTNLPPCGAYRGFGHSEFHFGIESHLDRAAAALGLSPTEIRRINAIRPGDPLPYGAKMNPGNLPAAIDAVARAMDLDPTPTPAQPKPQTIAPPHPPSPRLLHGKGIACFWKAPAMPPNASSAAYLKFNEDGSLNLSVSGMEIGQGFMTTMAQIAAEILALPPSQIRVTTPDTDRSPYEWQTVGSHVTWSCGNAVRAAACDVRDKLLATTARACHFKKSDLYLANAAVHHRRNPTFALPYATFAIDGIMRPDGRYVGGPIHGVGMFMPEFTSAMSDPETSQGGCPNVHYTVGCAGVEITLDPETGHLTILRAALAVDAGKTINPDLAKGQIVGGLLQGIATALYEDIRYSPSGDLLNPDFADYKIPSSLDCPLRVIPILLETPQPDGPFGARGLGEHTMIAAAPMLANAIDHAANLRLNTLPLTPEKIALSLNNLDYDALRGPTATFALRRPPAAYPFTLPVPR